MTIAPVVSRVRSAQLASSKTDANRLRTIGVCLLAAFTMGAVAAAPASAASSGAEAWGSNYTGQLGLGGKFLGFVPYGINGSEIPEVRPTGLEPGDNILSPVPVSGLSEAIAISETEQHGLALLKDHKTVMAWGENGSGSLGDGHSIYVNPSNPGPEYCSSNYMCSTVPVHVLGLHGKEVTAVLAGPEGNSMAVMGDGTVMEWGADINGGEPTYLPATVAGLTEVKAVASGDHFNLALLKNGTVMGWGDNHYGQLGMDPSGPENCGGTSCSKIPRPVPKLSNVIAISTLEDNSLALLEHGEVWAWGQNADGRLHNGTYSNEAAKVIGLEGVTAISAGASLSRNFALSNGKVMQWPGASGVPEQVSGLPEEVTAISAAGDHSLALVRGGAVWAWSEGEVPVPVEVNGLSEVTGIAAGLYDSFVFEAPLEPQTITFESTAPSNATVGGPTYPVAAKGGGSGNPVMFTIDAASKSVCTISGATVSFVGVGTCTIDANQAGNTEYEAAPQAQQPVTVSKRPQAITFISTAPSNASVGGATYMVSANGGASGEPVVLTIDAASSFVCTILGSTVSFTGVGTCMIDANQAGNTSYESAPQAQQSFSVVPRLPSITKLSPTKGPAAGGTTVTITGTGLTGATKVMFGSVSAASFKVTTVKTITSITAVSPAEVAKTVDVTVTTPIGTSAISSLDHFKFGPPTVTKLTPNSGSITGGTTVTVTGTGFGLGTEATLFKFGTTEATTVNCTSNTSCTVTAPSHVAGIVDVKATVTGQISPKALSDQFTYN
jgi:alpha-tubulin suppressor-like RCC1 family protein